MKGLFACTVALGLFMAAPAVLAQEGNHHGDKHDAAKPSAKSHSESGGKNQNAPGGATHQNSPGGATHQNAPAGITHRNMPVGATHQNTSAGATTVRDHTKTGGDFTI